MKWYTDSYRVPNEETYMLMASKISLKSFHCILNVSNPFSENCKGSYFRTGVDLFLGPEGSV